MVYGKQRHQQIMEWKSYLFRRLRGDKDVVMVTTQSKVSETSSVQVPEEVMMEARTCIYSESPLCSIAHAKLSANTTVSVGGSVTEIDPAEHVTVQPKQKKIKRQNFQIKDDTDSIRISMLGESTKQCKGLSVSDVVKVTNMNVNRSDETVSLDSTGSTRIHRVRSVGTQEARIEIVGIIKATRWETHLDAVFNQQLHTFVVAPRLLTKAFSLTLGSDFKQSVLDKMPLLADAVIRGNRIQKITAA